MKKLFVTIFLSSVLLSSVSYGAGLNGFFGITLNDNAEDYVSSNFIESNKGKHPFHEVKQDVNEVNSW